MWRRSGGRDPISAIIWAILLIYAGVILLADNLGYLDTVDGEPGCRYQSAPSWQSCRCGR